MVSIITAQPDMRQSKCGASQMFSHRYFAKAIERTAKWSLSAAYNPFDEVDFVSQSLMIETDFLKIVKQSLLGIPEAMH